MAAHSYSWAHPHISFSNLWDSSHILFDLTLKGEDDCYRAPTTIGFWIHLVSLNTAALFSLFLTPRRLPCRPVLLYLSLPAQNSLNAASVTSCFSPTATPASHRFSSHSISDSPFTGLVFIILPRTVCVHLCVRVALKTRCTAWESDHRNYQHEAFYWYLRAIHSRLIYIKNSLF